ncbi:hypothetical protein ACWFRM_42750 [Streptomyces sp. NPDC055144]
MGFHILLRDRKKQELNEALKVVTGAERDANDERSFIRIHVRNTADRPVLYVDALYEWVDGSIGRWPSDVPMVLKDVDLVRLFGRAGAPEAVDEEIVDGAHFGGVAGSRGSTTPMVT